MNSLSLQKLNTIQKLSQTFLPFPLLLLPFFIFNSILYYLISQTLISQAYMQTTTIRISTNQNKFDPINVPVFTKLKGVKAMVANTLKINPEVIQLTFFNSFTKVSYVLKDDEQQVGTIGNGFHYELKAEVKQKIEPNADKMGKVPIDQNKNTKQELELYEKMRPRQGLVLHSKCQNPKCKVFGKQIKINKGFGKFNMSKQSVKCQCPICYGKAAPATNFGFFKCKITIQGQKNDGLEEKRQLTCNDEIYRVYLQNGQINFADWCFFQIQAKLINIPEIRQNDNIEDRRNDIIPGYDNRGRDRNRDKLPSNQQNKRRFNFDNSRQQNQFGLTQQEQYKRRTKQQQNKNKQINSWQNYGQQQVPLNYRQNSNQILQTQRARAKLEQQRTKQQQQRKKRMYQQQYQQKQKQQDLRRLRSQQHQPKPQPQNGGIQYPDLLYTKTGMSLLQDQRQKTQSNQQSFCCVCLEKKAIYVNTSCYHMCYCENCYRLMMEKGNNRCPGCRRVGQYKKTYMV